MASAADKFVNKMSSYSILSALKPNSVTSIHIVIVIDIKNIERDKFIKFDIAGRQFCLSFVKFYEGPLKIKGF